MQVFQTLPVEFAFISIPVDRPFRKGLPSFYGLRPPSGSKTNPLYPCLPTQFLVPPKVGYVSVRHPGCVSVHVGEGV